MMRLLSLLLAAAALHGQSVVVSQVYGGGGNSGAVWRNDFVELFNRGSAPVSMAGWSVQYASATGTTWQVAPIEGTIEPEQYFLIQLAAGAGGTQSLPSPDAMGTLALGGTAGKIALVRGVAPLQDGRTLLADLVGYGLTANESETAPTPADHRARAILDFSQNYSKCRLRESIRGKYQQECTYLR